MDIFTVSLFGHRDITDLRHLDTTMCLVIEELIKTKSYVSFLIGRNGEFDEYTASVIKRIQKKHGKENSEIRLILPYVVKDVEFYENYYDNILIPECVAGLHPKSAIKKRNRWMIEQSDLVIAYLERENGGAYSAVKYAKRINKEVIYIKNRARF